jgi:serine/threonine protein kinase
MNLQRWRQAKKIFSDVLERAPEEREVFLGRACAGDAELRGEVEALLESHEEAEQESFIEAPPYTVAPGALGLAVPKFDACEGRSFGPYKVIREIARGGMGRVYLAERADDAYHKQVAIKLVGSGHEGDELRRRLVHERDILATLDHPNIARLLDGGTTEAGQPYIVMEYVEGVPVTRYCDERRLTSAERLKLFRAVCAAVSYAHRHLVIHRDLKPANILITKDGTPKLLDFGIAKPLGPAQADDGAHAVTRLGVMTPAYASPEQVRGERVTTATDIYSRRRHALRRVAARRRGSCGEGDGKVRRRGARHRAAKTPTPARRRPRQHLADGDAQRA